MRHTCCVIVALAVIAGPCGCKKETPPAAPPPKVNAELPVRKPPLTAIKRNMELPEIRNVLRQLGLAYTNFEVERNKAPAGPEDLLPYLDKNEKFIEPLRNGWITFIYGARRKDMPQGTSQTILAYEIEADGAGNRVVLMGDGSVHTLAEADFQKAPKALEKRQKGP